MFSRSAAPVGVFDSGIGGISVLAAIRRQLPAENVIYVADSGHLPYGEKPAHYIIDRALRITEYFLSQGAKAVAIPCNTATAAAIAELRRTYPGTPFVGIEPAVKPAARLTRSGVIGVLATTGTLASDKFRELVQREAPGIEVLLKPCSGWVDLVERARDADQVQALVAEPLNELLAQGADVLVLGCTHFPFLIEPIRKCVGPDLPVLETGEPFARQLRLQLQRQGLLRADGMGEVRFLTSGEPATVQDRASFLLGRRAEVARLPTQYCGLHTGQ